MKRPWRLTLKFGEGQLINKDDTIHEGKTQWVPEEILNQVRENKEGVV